MTEEILKSYKSIPSFKKEFYQNWSNDLWEMIILQNDVKQLESQEIIPTSKDLLDCAIKAKLKIEMGYLPIDSLKRNDTIKFNYEKNRYLPYVDRDTFKALTPMNHWTIKI